MRTGRARLIEWIEDIQTDPLDAYGFPETSASERSDRIMEDINRGIITAEVDG